MKNIRLDEIRDRARSLVQDANFILPGDVAARLETMAAVKESDAGRDPVEDFVVETVDRTGPTAVNIKCHSHRVLGFEL